MQRSIQFIGINVTGLNDHGTHEAKIFSKRNSARGTGFRKELLRHAATSANLPPQLVAPRAGLGGIRKDGLDPERLL